MDRPPALDRDDLLSRLGHDEELVNEILGLFADESETMLAAVVQAVAIGDARALERSAHTVRGALLNIGAKSAAQAVAEMEQLGRAGSVEGAESALSRLRCELERLRIQLPSVFSGCVR